MNLEIQESVKVKNALSLYTPKQQAIPSHLIVVEYSADNGLVRASVIRLPFSDGEEGG